ncbi:MAG: phosphodiester glycosidase family protein [Armatimonadota bacterium]
MTRVFIIILLLLVGIDAEAGNVAYSKAWLRGTPVHVVTVNMNSPNVRVSPALARYGIGSSEGFGSMLSRLSPTAAVTGTYFCVRRLLPVGDIVINGDLVHFGPVGTGLCITPDNRVEFRTTDYARHKDWSGFSTVNCSGPRLVAGGVPSVNPWAEGFNAGICSSKARRAAAGVTRGNKLLLVTVNKSITSWQLAYIMRDLGTVDAIQFDGGSSTAMYCKGKVLSHPTRRLTNLLVVYDSPKRFANIQPHLAPNPVLASR